VDDDDDDDDDVVEAADKFAPVVDVVVVDMRLALVVAFVVLLSQVGEDASLPLSTTLLLEDVVVAVAAAVVVVAKARSTQASCRRTCAQCRIDIDLIFFFYSSSSCRSDTEYCASDE
jgi:hypothetical protein